MVATRTLHEESIVVRCPFTVIVDTREQAPFRFLGIDDDQTRQPLIVPLITDQALSTGDYSISGLESALTVERKSVGDFASSITHDRDRFESEMERMRMMVDVGGYAAVVIEGDWNELLYRYPERSRVSAKCISRTIASWSIRYRVQFWPCMNRRHAELWTFRLLSMFWRQKQREREEKAQQESQSRKQNESTAA